jgi:hypothetical protein
MASIVEFHEDYSIADMLGRIADRLDFIIEILEK